jgi:Zn-dependent peptidase ImmA (M78 family)
MTENAFIVPPLSRRAIRQVAGLMREACKCKTPMLDVMRLVEFWLPEHDEGFTFLPVSREELGDIHGLTVPSKRVIKLREDVYYGALDGKGRDRMTVAHELGHYVLHRSVEWALLPPGGTIPAYRSSEWQASAFAAELLIAFDHVVECRDERELPSMFGVTRDAARVQWAVLKQEGVKS